MTKNLSKSLIAQRKKSEPFRKTLYGSLGIPLNGAKLVQVPNRQSYVYVRLNDNENEVIQAFNNTVSPSYDLPVVVARDGGRYTVKQVNTQRYENNWNNSSPYLPAHGTAHSFFPGGGADISWIYSRQIMHGLVYPTVTGTTLDIASFPLYTPNGWVLAGATGTVNLLQYRPVSGSASLMALLYADANNGNPGLLVNSGSYIDYAITGSVYPYIPRPNLATQIPLAAIRISTGTLNIGWDNLYDVRQWIHAIPSGSSSGGGGGGVDTIGFAGLYNGVPLGTGTMLNVRGNASFSRSGTMFDLYAHPPGVDQIGVYGLNQGSPVGTGSWFNVNGSRLLLTISGTMLDLTNSPDPQELIGIYSMSGTVGQATGTSISFGDGLWSSVTGTIIYLGLSPSYLSGWSQVNIQWTRTGDFTFTVTGDVTATYQKGTKIRYRDGGAGFEYGVIKSSTFSTPNTTVTLFTNTDYAMSANPKDTYISYIENPEGFPAEFNYSPTFNNFTANNATLFGKFEIHGRRCIQKAGFIFGSTPSVITGTLSLVPITTPLGLGTTQEYFGATTIRDTGTALFEGTVYLIGGNLFPQVSATSGAYAAPTNVNATVPMTWVSTDELSMVCEYTF